MPRQVKSRPVKSRRGFERHCARDLLGSIDGRDEGEGHLDEEVAAGGGGERLHEDGHRVYPHCSFGGGQVRNVSRAGSACSSGGSNSQREQNSSADAPMPRSSDVSHESSCRAFERCVAWMAMPRVRAMCRAPELASSMSSPRSVGERRESTVCRALEAATCDVLLMYSLSRCVCSDGMRASAMYLLSPRFGCAARRRLGSC
jgi:hypothetical protein